MLPPQNEEEATDQTPMNPPTSYGQVTASMNLLLPAIQENQTEDPQRPSFKTITTIPRFQTQHSVRYNPDQRFKVKKKNSKRRPKHEEDSDDDDDDIDGYNFDEDDNAYDVWHRPMIDNEEANEDGKHLILNEYENITSEGFIELMLENETECDKLAQLMCNKKVSSKDLSKPNRDCDKYQLFDVLRLSDENDTGGLNVDDYDIDMREMEHLFNEFNNEILHTFMDSYFNNTLPFEPREPYPMGIIETDITQQRKVKCMKNPNYINQNRRKHKQRLKEKHRKQKEKARKKRRKEKKMKMKLAQRKRDKIKEKLSKSLAPDVLNILFSPDIIDPNAKPEEEEELFDEKEEIKDDNLRTDDEALGNVVSADTKERIKNMRIQRQRSRRKDRMSADRHSAALASPVMNNLANNLSLGMGMNGISMNIGNQNNLMAMISQSQAGPEFDDEKQMNIQPINNVFDKQQLSMEAPPAMSKDYEGTVKRYARPIKMDQVEKVYKYVLFKAARQYFAKIYLLNRDIKQCIEQEMLLKSNDYDQIKYQIETTDEDKQDVCTDVVIKNNGHGLTMAKKEIKCDLDISYYISMKKKRDTDVLVQKHYVQKQRSMLQLMSMGVDLDDIENDHDSAEAKDEISFHHIKQAFVDGISGLQISAEDKLHNHDEDDDNVRMSGIVYDSDDDKVNDRRWSSRGKWVEKALIDYCENEKKENTVNPKPWKKLHSKYVDEFVRKLCGFYPFESRPVAWKRIWHQNMAFTQSSEMWPDDWMDQFDAGTLNMSAFNNECNNELDNSKIKHVKCVDQITGELFGDENNTLQYGCMFEENEELKSFYDRVLNNIPKLQLDVDDLELPQFIWKLNECDLCKYGTYLLANWKQSSDGKVTTNTINHEKFPLAQFRTDVEQRRWLSNKKWYVYRLRYWEAEDIEDFLDELQKEGVEWFGSNDRISHTLIEDRICIQNDHCYGQPNSFIWSHDFCNEASASSEAIKIRNYGVSADVASNDAIIQAEKSMFNLDAPIVATGSMPSDGPIRSGTRLPIGARDIEFGDYSDINGIIAMDAYIPPIFNLSVYDDMDTLYYNWNRVNHNNCPDRASSKTMQFINKNSTFDKMIADANNILKSWDDQSNDWIDYKNYPVFDKYHHSHPCVLSNAFFFHNFLSRTFHYGPKNIAKICYPKNYQQAIFCDTKEQGSEEWTLAFGFTHPRPIAPEKYAVLLYKKDAIEVRITSDTEKIIDDEKKINLKFTDLTPHNIDEKSVEEFELIDSGAKYQWSEERLEIMLNIYCDGKMKSVQLFSELIRDQFTHKDCFHEINKDFSHKSTNKKFIFTENYFMSHVVMVCKSKNGEIKCYLDGRIVCQKSIADLINIKNKSYHTNLLNHDNDILIAHKPGNKKGKVHGLFHGYLYAISLHSLHFQPFELNTLYRQLCVHRDLHCVSTWFRNKKQLSHQIYKQFL